MSNSYWIIIHLVIFVIFLLFLKGIFYFKLSVYCQILIYKKLIIYKPIILWLWYEFQKYIEKISWLYKKLRNQIKLSVMRLRKF